MLFTKRTSILSFAPNNFFRNHCRIQIKWMNSLLIYHYRYDEYATIYTPEFRKIKVLCFRLSLLDFSMLEKEFILLSFPPTILSISGSVSCNCFALVCFKCFDYFLLLIHAWDISIYYTIWACISLLYSQH